MKVIMRNRQVDKVMRQGIFGLIVMTLLTLPVSAQELKYEEFTLDNGLRVVVHEDRKAPIVTVQVSYKVGSKEESRGKTGFAHLFEHILFRGSENFTGSFSDVLGNIGATGVNGGTGQDSTYYVETVPTPGLELALWLESDRMGHLLGAVTQEALDDERGIVKNEIRQRESQPYSGMFTRAFEGLFPVGHPYHHSIGGTDGDLDRATLEDVHAWFKRYYGAANALIVLSGDIDAKTARPLMEKYFGDIASGPPLLQMKSWIPERTKITREILRDNVSKTLVQRVWAVPGFANKDRVLLDITASILGEGKTSRLYRELVEKRELAGEVQTLVGPLHIAGLFIVTAGLKPGVDPAKVEQAIDEVMAEYLKKGPTKKEVDGVKNRFEIDHIRNLEGVKGKAGILSQGVLSANDAGFILNQGMTWTRGATRKDVHAAAKKWLLENYHQTKIMPFGTHKTTPSTFDRSQAPKVVNDITLDLPEMQEAVLSNGMKVVLAARPETPIVDMTMVFDHAGSISDIKAGSAKAAFAVMGDGPQGMNAAAFVDQKDQLGLEIKMSAGAHEGKSSAFMLKKNLTKSLALWADALRRPAFRADDFTDMRDHELEDIDASRYNPGAIGHNILSSVLYGSDHPYTYRWDKAETLKALQLADLKGFHNEWVTPGKATLYVTGATSLPKIIAQLEQVFGDWKPSTNSAKSVKAIKDVAVPGKPRIILVDKPLSKQTTLLAGRLLPSSRDKKTDILDAANSALGDGKSGRLSAKLRVEKAWTYGAKSGAYETLAQRNWHVDTKVQTDKTAESMVEIIKELTEIGGDRPVTAEELTLFVNSQTLTLPGSFEKGSALLKTMQKGARYGRPYDWIEGQKAKLESLSLAEVNQAAAKYFNPQTMTWVLVGDLEKIEQKVRDLNIGDVEIWDAEGKKIR